MAQQMTALQRTDRKLLEILQRDGRLTNLELAARVNLSASACLRRVRALEEAGVIRRYAALVDPAKVGLGLLAFVTVKLEKRGRMPTRPDVPVNPTHVSELLKDRKIVATIFAGEEQKKWQGLFKDIFRPR